MAKIEVVHQLLSDFKQIDQCNTRLEVCKGKIAMCQNTIKQFKATDIDPQQEVADLARLQKEQAGLLERLPGLVSEFKVAMHAKVARCKHALGHSPV